MHVPWAASVLRSPRDSADLVICLSKTVLTSKIVIINKRTILLPSVLGTERTELQGPRGALHHWSPGCWLRMRCHSSAQAPSPQKAFSNRLGCAKLIHHRQVPSPATQQHPPRGWSPLRSAVRSCVLLPGALLGFGFDYCVSWPTVRWGWARKGTGARSAAKALTEPGCFPAAQAPRGQGACAAHADYVAKGKAFP